MLAQELAILAHKDPKDLVEILLKGMKHRHPGDQVPRCLICGICMPTHLQKAHDSIYSELCAYCGKKKI